MKLKPGFILRQYGDQWVAVAVGDTREKNFMLSMNKTGAFLWSALQQDTTRQQLLDLLTGHYRVSPEDAAKDLQQLLDVLTQYDLLEI